MVPTTKRSRACDPCHTLKIRCDLIEGSACSRCTRLGKDCTVSSATASKGNRLRELEAKVEALTKALEVQQLAESRSSSSSVQAIDLGSISTAARAPPTKRRRRSGESSSEDQAATARSTESCQSNSGTNSSPRSGRLLDDVVPVEMQARLVSKYVTDMSTRSPFVPLPGNCALEDLRTNRPLLLRAVVWAACSGVLQPDHQDEVAKVLFGDLESVQSTSNTTEGIAYSIPKALDHVQALQITGIFYRSPKHQVWGTAFEMTRRAIDAAARLAADCSSNLLPTSESGRNEMIEVCRASLVSYIMWESTVFYGRTSPLTYWTEQNHSWSLSQLEYSPHAFPTDRLLCQHVRLARLCERVAIEMGYCDPSNPGTSTDYVMQQQMLRNALLDLRITVPQSLQQPSQLLFLFHVASVYIEEAVLHTSTNGSSFTAPYLAERLSVTDFPKPVDPIQYTSAVYTLLEGAQGALDTLSSLNSFEVTNLPGLIYAARAAYALYILVKLYIACTGAGNTYGVILTGQDIRVHEYLDLQMAVARRVSAIDVQSPSARVLSSAIRMNEWVQNYDAIVVGSMLSVEDDGTSLAMGDAIGVDLLGPFDIPLTEDVDVLAELFPTS